MAGAETGMLAQVGAMLKSIMASAGETFAGIFGFLSPIMGPAAAGPAAAGEATVMSVASMVSASAAGGYDIPANVSGLLAYHPREMILPAPIADRIRNITEPGGQGDVHMHGAQFHFHGDKWEEGIRRNPGVLYKAIKDGIRDAQLKFR
jgi:hypothetical protein